MKNLLVLVAALCAFNILAQQHAAVVNITGISKQTADLMKKNGDRISWYSLDNGGRLQRNVKVEVRNVGLKPKDGGFAAVEANPDADGQYKFNTTAEIKIKKIDTTKNVVITVVLETVMGNEVCATVEREFSAISQAITLDRYMWREGNDKISPERRLCISFSTFLNDKSLREKVLLENTAFKLTDFEVFLKQGEKGEWIKFPEPLQGKINNGTAVELTNMLPANIDPSKMLYVRFFAKTTNGNFVWGEYVVAPNEYRKEFRATHYTGEAFKKDAPLK